MFSISLCPSALNASAAHQRALVLFVCQLMRDVTVTFLSSVTFESQQDTISFLISLSCLGSYYFLWHWRPTLDASTHFRIKSFHLFISSTLPSSNCRRVRPLHTHLLPSTKWRGQVISVRFNVTEQQQICDSTESGRALLPPCRWGGELHYFMRRPCFK